MKILMINDYEEYGGTELHIEDLTNLLKEQGHDIFHFFINKKFNKNSNKFIYYFHHNWFNYKLYKKLEEYINKINPDLIHIHNNYLYTNSILMACKNYKIIQTIHDYGIICPIAWGIKKNNLSLCNCKAGLKCGISCLPFLRNLLSFYLPNLLRKRLIKKNIKTFISPSIELKKILEENNFNNVVYLPNFKIKQDWKPKIRRTKKTILFVGALEKHKGLSYLISAIKQVIRIIKDAKLIIIGEGSEKEKLIKSCSDFKKNITFMGNVDNNNLKEYYRDSTIVIIPSTGREQFSLVCIEAMALGKPIIASEIGGLKDLIEDNKNGFLVKRFDTKDLAEKIIYLLKNPKIAEKMGQESKKLFLENFTEEKYLTKFNKILKK